MARSLHRDRFAWICSLPTCITLLVCLGLPQIRDCDGHVKTAAENGTSTLLIVMALVALAPLAWRWPALRSAVAVLAAIAGVIAVMSSVLVLPIAIYCVIARPWVSTEQFVAFICGCIALVFVLVFPLVGLFSHLLYGASLTWTSAFVVMVSSFAWTSAARRRSSITVPPPIVEPAPMFEIPRPPPAPVAMPNIVKVTNIVATPDHIALVMEYVAGHSLEHALPTLVGQPVEITRIMLGILAAVEHAHRAGVIHRDLKPANVLLEGAQRIPRVTDFGSAKVTDASYVRSFAYMSPEQIRGPRFVTTRSDVFSLGIVLYEMATGALPFDGDSDDALIDAIVRGHYVLSKDVDPVIAHVIRFALQPDPAHRFQSCAEMADALHSADGW